MMWSWWHILIAWTGPAFSRAFTLPSVLKWRRFRRTLCAGQSPADFLDTLEHERRPALKVAFPLKGCSCLEALNRFTVRLSMSFDDSMRNRHSRCGWRRHVISNRIPLLVFGRRAHLVTGHRIVEPHHPPSKQEYLYNIVSKSRSIRYSIILEYFNKYF